MDLDPVLYFEQLMQLKSQNPAFYFEFKKHRSEFLQEKAPEKKELYYVTYLRMIENERLEKEKEIARRAKFNRNREQ